jgi:hypothetical protein
MAAMNLSRLAVAPVLLAIVTGPAAAGPAKTIYLDRCEGGCELFPGSDRASDNRTSLIDSPAQLTEWRYSDMAWDQLVACVADIYAAFDVTVTDELPDAGQPHQRAIVAGSGPELGSDFAESLGVAPTWCEVHDDVITFTFANGFSDPSMICAVVAQETGHAYGLEHTFACDDAMSWAMPCGDKLFRDADNQCGEQVALDECICGGTTTNSFRAVMSLLGKSADMPGPTGWAQADIFDFDNTPPISDDGPFQVSATVDDPYGIDRVELYINGVLWGPLPHSSFNEYFDWIEDDVSDGLMDLKVIAYNTIGVSTVLNEFQAIKRAPCQTSADCLDGAACSEGRCAQPVAYADFGDECASNDDCATNLCAASETATTCSRGCYDVPGGDTCPDGYWCHGADQTGAACWPGERPPEPETEPESSGCSATTGSGAGQVAWLVLLALFALRARTRARARAQ